MDSDDVCREFRRGRCVRGDQCRFKHVKLNVVCLDFKRYGYCARKDRCRYMHKMPREAAPAKTPSQPIVAAKQQEKEEPSSADEEADLEVETILRHEPVSEIKEEEEESVMMVFCGKCNCVFPKDLLLDHLETSHAVKYLFCLRSPQELHGEPIPSPD